MKTINLILIYQANNFFCASLRPKHPIVIQTNQAIIVFTLVIYTPS